jgi:RNAse (barnase) inhibitor barstar
MSVFSGDPSEWQRLDWQLLQNGAVALYFSTDVLSEDLRWLRDHGYELHEFDCQQWTSAELVHSDFKRILKFPDYYGNNLDALHDCLSELAIPSGGGTALVFNHYDSYAKAAGAARINSGRTFAELILDIVASTSRSFLLVGMRLVAMIQSDDPRIRFEVLGCTHAVWNPREWLDEKRGL